METKIACKELQKKVGENIEHFRLLKKKNIKEMASLLELTDTSYRNIERGITEITLSKFFQISKALGVHYSQLLNVCDEPTNNDKLPSDPNSPLLEGYKLCIQQYKEEIQFLRHEIDLLGKGNR